MISSFSLLLLYIRPFHFPLDLWIFHLTFLIKRNQFNFRLFECTTRRWKARKEEGALQSQNSLVDLFGGGRWPRRSQKRKQERRGDAPDEPGRCQRGREPRQPVHTRLQQPTRQQPEEEERAQTQPDLGGRRQRRQPVAGLLIYISIHFQLTNPNSLNTQSVPIFSITNDNNILSPFNDVTSNWINFIVSLNCIYVTRDR